jgi:integrase
MQSEGKFKNKTAREVRDMIRQHLSPDEQKPVTFGTWYAHFTNTHENSRTRAIYDATWVQVCRYDLNASERKFEDINKAWLDGFFRWCARTSPSINARNIHLRNIRAVFNDAIDNDITTAYPFRRMKITPVATPKRNLPVEVLREIFMADVEPWRRRYYDAFRLSFLLIGMNIVDLCNLTPEQYRTGRIQYNRRKTHRLYNIKVEREAREIIERNRGNELLLSWSEGRTSYRQFAAKVNKFLPDNITTYYARHSWATIAASLDIPDDVISQALGHAARNSTTAIYIERSQRKVDEANRRVIDFVLKG